MIHEMILFGAFMSHIPMFHKPHDVQVVFKLKQANLCDGCVFTPEPFDLEDAIAGKVKTLRGDKGTVDIEAVVLVARLDEKKQNEETYAVIGGRYLLHRIHGRDDVDQIVALAAPIARKTVTTATLLKVGQTVNGARVAAELSKLRGPDFVD